ncbi:Protein of unknown function [Pseudomonas benzenivorans]|nr:DUF3995 domain-containing protein [Pseudomonas benzenivorans]SDH94916.1 Protein of unknown function [Pseudomonas benzenivorans]
MTLVLPITLCSLFTVLGGWHFYWAFGGRLAASAAIPEVDGRPTFTPSGFATVLVGLALVACAALIAATAGLLPVPVPGRILAWLCYALAFVLGARAIGDFRLVGFFKRVRGSRFASLDTFVYSPLCLALAVGVLLVGSRPAS